ncbi:hypothetical protein ACOME3_000911 [Neoechinorhynchus agilis]
MDPKSAYKQSLRDKISHIRALSHRTQIMLKGVKEETKALGRSMCVQQSSLREVKKETKLLKNKYLNTSSLVKIKKKVERAEELLIDTTRKKTEILNFMKEAAKLLKEKKRATYETEKEVKRFNLTIERFGKDREKLLEEYKNAKQLLGKEMFNLKTLDEQRKMQNNVLETIHRSTENEFSRLKAVGIEVGNYETKITAIDMDIGNQQRESSEIIRWIGILTKKMNELDVVNAKLNEDVSNVKWRFGQKQRLLTQNQSELKVQNETLKLTENASKQIIAKINDLKKQKVNTKLNLRNSKEEMSKMKRTSDETHKQIISIMDECSQARRSIAALEQQIADRLQNTKSIKNERNSKLFTTLEMLKSQSDNESWESMFKIRMEIEILISKVLKKQAELEPFQEKKLLLHDKLVAAKRATESSESDLELLKRNHRKDKDALLMTLRKSAVLDDTNRDKTELYVRLETTNNDLRSRLTSLEKNRETSVVRSFLLKVESKRFAQTIRDLQLMAKSNNHEYQKSEHVLRSKQFELQMARKRVGKSVNAIGSKRESALLKVSDLEDHRLHLMEILNQKQDKIHAIESEVVRLEGECSEWEVQLKVATEKRLKYKDKLNKEQHISWASTIKLLRDRKRQADRIKSILLKQINNCNRKILDIKVDQVTFSTSEKMMKPCLSLREAELISNEIVDLQSQEMFASRKFAQTIQSIGEVALMILKYYRTFETQCSDFDEYNADKKLTVKLLNSLLDKNNIYSEMIKVVDELNNATDESYDYLIRIIHKLFNHMAYLVNDRNRSKEFLLVPSQKGLQLIIEAHIDDESFKRILAEDFPDQGRYPFSNSHELMYGSHKRFEGLEFE